MYFEKIFPSKLIKWNKIYLLLLKETCNTYWWWFQHKILNNILYLNKKFYKFRLTDNPFCSFCKTEHQGTSHDVHSWTLTSQLWSQRRLFLEPDVTPPDLLPQAAIFGFPAETNCQSFVLFNHLLLLFKLNVYNSRNDTVLCLNKLLRDITKIKI